MITTIIIIVTIVLVLIQYQTLQVYKYITFRLYHLTKRQFDMCLCFLFVCAIFWFKGDGEVVEYDDYDFKATQLFKYKDENKDLKNDNNFSNEIMLSNIINDNGVKHEFLSSIPGIFKLMFLYIYMNGGTAYWCRTVPFIHLHVYSMDNQSCHVIFKYELDQIPYFNNLSVCYDGNMCIYDN